MSIDGVAVIIGAAAALVLIASDMYIKKIRRSGRDEILKEYKEDER